MKTYVCAGEEVNLNKKFQIGCESSSNLDKFDCKAGTNGMMKDESNMMFHLDNQGIGGWIKLSFSE